jgi:hypothetical protein
MNNARIIKCLVFGTASYGVCLFVYGTFLYFRLTVFLPKAGSAGRGAAGMDLGTISHQYHMPTAAAILVVVYAAWMVIVFALAALWPSKGVPVS